MAAAAADPREFSKVVDADHDLNFQMSGGASAVKDVDSAPGTAFGWDYAKGVHTSSGPVFPLTCAAQQYAWGKVGSSSKVAQMKAADAGFSVDEAQTYAEYWMGTHPNAPSRTPDGTTLAAFLAANPGALGDKLGDALGDALGVQRVDQSIPPVACDPHAVLAESESSISRLLQSLSDVVLANIWYMLVTLLTSNARGWSKADASLSA